MKTEEVEQELENNKADMVFPTNEGYIKVENIERVKDVIISKSVRISKIIEQSELKGKTFKAEITIKDTVMLILLLPEGVKEHEEEGDLKTGSFVATGNMAELLQPRGKKTQAVPKPSFSSVQSPMQRIKFPNWEPIAKTRIGIVYREVIERILEDYTEEGVEPSLETISQAIQEMYGKHLKESTLVTYANGYRRYIRENKLAEAHFTKEEYKEDAKDLRVIPIEQVVEIWNLLPGEFTYKQVKALIPAGIMQSGARVDATNYTIREFKVNSAFECEEPSPGVFLKKVVER